MLIKERIHTTARIGFIDITPLVQSAVKTSKISDGVALVFCPHTTAGITINENADPDVAQDIKEKLSRLVPVSEGYAHREGNADAHIKSSLIGASESIIIDKGSLVLGTWQGIYFCEFDGPRSRHVYINVIG